MRRKDPFTPDLFSWQPPDIAAGYEDDVAGRGALDSKIARLVSRALRDAKDDEGKTRSEIVEEMSAFLGRGVSLSMLEKWASEASDEHRIPLDAFIALIQATGAKGLLGFVPGLFDHVAIPSKYADVVELHLIEEHEAEVAARKATLKARWRARQ